MPNGQWFCSNCSCLHKEFDDTKQIKSGSILAPALPNPNIPNQTNYLYDPGFCQLCMFPFKHNADSSKETETDCAPNPYWHEFYCPLAIDAETNRSVGFPFEVGCPLKEDWESQPTCFETNLNSAGSSWIILLTP